MRTSCLPAKRKNAGQLGLLFMNDNEQAQPSSDKAGIASVHAARLPDPDRCKRCARCGNPSGLMCYRRAGQLFCLAECIAEYSDHVRKAEKDNAPCRDFRRRQR